MPARSPGRCGARSSASSRGSCARRASCSCRFGGSSRGPLRPPRPARRQQSASPGAPPCRRSRVPRRGDRRNVRAHAAKSCAVDAEERGDRRRLEVEAGLTTKPAAALMNRRRALTFCITTTASTRSASCSARSSMLGSASRSLVESDSSVTISASSEHVRRAASNPTRNAAPGPWFSPRRITSTGTGPSYASTIAAVESWDPSSTMTTRYVRSSARCGSRDRRGAWAGSLPRCTQAARRRAQAQAQPSIAFCRLPSPHLPGRFPHRPARERRSGGIRLLGQNPKPAGLGVSTFRELAERGAGRSESRSQSSSSGITRSLRRRDDRRAVDATPRYGTSAHAVQSRDSNRTGRA